MRASNDNTFHDIEFKDINSKYHTHVVLYHMLDIAFGDLSSFRVTLAFIYKSGIMTLVPMT